MQGRQEGQEGQAQRQFVELARTGEDTIWSVLMEFGNAQATHNHGGLGSIDHGALPARCTTRSRSPTARSTTRPSGRPTSARATTTTFSSPRRRASARCGTSTSRTRPAPTPSTARSRTGSQLPFNEAALRLELLRQHRLRRDIQRLLEDGLNGWYARQVAAGKTAAADQHVPGAVRQVGPVRLQQQRQLQRAGRLHRPLPGDPRRRGRGDRRRPPGHRRHLEPSLVHERGRPGHRRPDGNLLGGVRIGNSNSGSATTPSSRRTAASACSRTSSATTSASRTSTTPSGNTGGAENSTGFWTPWSSGSYGSDGTPANGIGNRPFSMSAWDKLVFGWLDYQVVQARRRQDQDHARPV